MQRATEERQRVALQRDVDDLVARCAEVAGWRDECLENVAVVRRAVAALTLRRETGLCANCCPPATS
jgi:hypothetical protein